MTARRPRPAQQKRTASRGDQPRGTVSLARALSKLGICSRSQAEEAVRAGRVHVNGRRITDSSVRVVPERDTITMDGTTAAAAVRTYVMLNKPRGVLTTRRDPRERATVYDHLTDASLPFLGPVGRLDQATEGLLLLTNDTQWGNAISAPESHVRKTYHVQVDRLPDAAFVDALRRGVEAEAGEQLRAAQVDLLRSGERHGWIVVELDEGKNRQIRRMVEACGAQVLRLVRVGVGPVLLGALPKGAWRHLTTVEVTALGRAAGRVSSSRRTAP